MFSKQQTNMPYPAISPSSLQSANNSNYNSSGLTHSVPLKSRASEIQAKLVNEILSSNKIKFKKNETPSMVVQNELTRIWNQNIEILALSLLKKPSAVHYTKHYSQLMVNTGQSAAALDPSFHQFALITGVITPHQPLNIQSYGDLGGGAVELSAPDMHVYIPIYYHSSNDALSGKQLAKALNYYLGEKKWAVTLYFENSNNLLDTLAKKNAWLNRNTEMLEQISKKYNVKIIPQEYNDILTEVNLDTVAAFFVDLLSVNNALKHSLKRDVKHVLAPKSKADKPNPVNEYFQLWVDLLDDTSKDPNLSPEAKYKLLYFWYAVCNPPKTEKIPNNSFSFFKGTQRQAAIIPVVADHEDGLRAGLQKIAVR
jgi:hypothetical protein